MNENLPNATGTRSDEMSAPRRIITMRAILSLSVALLIGLTAAIAGWIVESGMRDALTTEVQSRLVLEARNLAQVSGEAILSQYPELVLCPIVSEMQNGRDDLAYVVVVDHRGLIQGHVEPRMLGEPFAVLDGLTPVTSRAEMAPGESLMRDTRHLVATSPAMHGSKRVGAAIVALDHKHLDGLVARTRRELTLATAPLLITGLGAMFLLVSWLLRPIRTVRAGLERIGHGDLETPILIRDRTEIGLLADTVNEMAFQLEASRDEALAKEQEIIDTQKEVIQRLGAIVESRSRETANHIIRVGKCAELLARLAGLDDEEAELILLASPMHDVGKVAIPDTILNKPTRLSDDEFEAMMAHTTLGHELLKNSHRPIMRAAATIAHEHHEKWDGTGYPRRLSGKDIHIYGRIVAIVDVFDALRSKRVYKDAIAVEETLDIMRADRGRHFDPELLDLFVAHIDEFVSIAETYRSHEIDSRLEAA